MDSIRREIINPVHQELEHSAKLGRFSVWVFWIGLIGGVLAIISIALALSQGLEPKPNVPLQINNVPRSFYFSYTFDPPGRRDWNRISEDTWVESSPDGRRKEFRISGRSIYDNCVGSLLYHIADSSRKCNKW